ncbi:MAG: hypothetical protein HN341_08800 [Verrucomicrobia bacterium]|jgi:endonuclease YncB( thermonuclease family)|nr:hypothetical protein [Verrucomicrobiota bacterium]
MKANGLILFLCAALLAAASAGAAELQTFSNVVLSAPFHGDGDSFRVKLGDREVTIRLYFVDCPETSVGNSTDARRVRAQTRYFGLTSGKETVRFGKEAAAFTQQQLAKPFTVCTAFASAPGRSAGGRQYGFVRNSKGQDLGDLLVASGLARAYGIRRRTPEDVPHDEQEALLNDVECSAMLARRGVWASTDPERLVALRAAARKEEAELRAFYELAQEPLTAVDINTAESDALIRLPGIGEVTAARIISGRPYHVLEDLTRVPGIGVQTLERIRPHVTIQ